jgi:hypothetical protein
MLVVNPNDGAPARVFYPTRKGAELLAVELRDDSWLSTCTQTPNWQHLNHWIACSKLHVLFDRAAELSPDVTVTGFLHEWAVANPEEKEPHKRFRLFTLLRENPRLVCNPDSAFLLEFGQHRRAYYVEVDRATTGINAIAASKTQGYAQMLREQTHRRHFPTTTFDDFSVLQVSTTANRRDALRKAILPKDGSKAWRFVAWPEMTAESLLHGDLIYDCEKGPRPLVRRPEGGSERGPEAVRRGTPEEARA